MTFAAPEWLLGLIFLPLLALVSWLAWRNRGQHWQKLVAPRLRNRLSQTRPAWVHFTAMGLGLAGLGSLIVAVAQPESGEEWIEVQSEGRNILFCIDISRSMLAEDVSPSRLLAARAAALEVLARFPNDRIGVLLFAGEPLVQSPLTIDHSFVEQTLAQLNPNDIPAGGSDLTKAVEVGTALLVETGQQSNIMVVFSDGEKSSDGAGTDEGLALAAQAAAEEGIFIYAIGMGTPEGSFIPDRRERDGKFRDRNGSVVFSKLEEASLQLLAAQTDGVYSKGMASGFLGELDSALAKMDRFREEGRQQRIAKPAHRWFVVGGLLLIMSSLFVRGLPLARLASLALLFAATPQLRADLIGEGVEALNSGRTGDAYGKFSKAARESSGNRAASLHLAAGSAASQGGDWPTAVAAFSEALRSNQADLQQKAHYALATALFYQGASLEKEEKATAWKGSIEHFEAALSLNPDDQATRDNLESVRQQLAELLKPPPEQDPQDRENQAQDKPQEPDPKEDKPEEEKPNDSGQNDEQDPPKKDSGQDEKPKQDPSGEQSQPQEQKDPSDPKDGEGSRGGQSDEPSNDQKPDQQSPDQGKPDQQDSNGQEQVQGQVEPDPNAPKNETPKERARRLLKQYSDSGGKAPRRKRVPYYRTPHDW